MRLFVHRLLDLAFWTAVFVIATTNTNNNNSFSVEATTSASCSSALAFLKNVIGSPLTLLVTRSRRRKRSDDTIISCRAIKVTIRIVGRRSGGEEWLEQACSMYEKRLKPNNIEMSTIWHKTNDALCKAVLNHEKDKTVSPVVVLLDPECGKSCTSLQFAEQFYAWAQDGGSRLVFVIGGAEGLPDELRFPASISSNNNNKQSCNNSKKPPIFLNLSDLTFTHQFARLLLTEQIYRASEIVSFS
jgi:23S rRNA (pseudouridine1915-N3)-methyltransferase